MSFFRDTENWNYERSPLIRILLLKPISRGFVGCPLPSYGRCFSGSLTRFRTGLGLDFSACRVSCQFDAYRNGPHSTDSLHACSPS